MMDQPGLGATDDTKQAVSWLAGLSTARQMLEAAAPEQRAAYLIRRGSMRVGLYAPRGMDHQTPHSQDEVYIVLQGRSAFIKGEARCQVGAGDVVFVAAGEMHCFEDFTADFETWVIFWGPEGGE